MLIQENELWGLVLIKRNLFMLSQNKQTKNAGTMSSYLNKLPRVAVKQTDEVFTITSFGQRQELAICAELYTLH